MIITLDKLREIRTRGERPALPIVLSTFGHFESDHPVITDDGDFTVLMNLEVYLAVQEFNIVTLLALVNRILICAPRLLVIWLVKHEKYFLISHLGEIKIKDISNWFYIKQKVAL